MSKIYLGKVLKYGNIKQVFPFYWEGPTGPPWWLGRVKNLPAMQETQV